MSKTDNINKRTQDFESEERRTRICRKKVISGTNNGVIFGDSWLAAFRLKSKLNSSDKLRPPTIH